VVGKKSFMYNAVVGVEICLSKKDKCVLLVNTTEHEVLSWLVSTTSWHRGH